MSGTTHTQKKTVTLTNNLGVLPEDVRREYLMAMGIQTWYDPQLVLPDKTTEIESPPIASPAIHSESHTNEIIETPASEKNASLPNKSFDDSIPQVDVQSPLIQKPDSSVATLSALQNSIEQCQLCELHATRHHAISGEGNVAADLMIVVSAPVKEENTNEDALFVNSHKAFLQQLLKAIDIDLPSVYLTSLVKCQPPEQRNPYTSEVICCDEHLSSQIKLIQPKAIMVLGEDASQQLLVSQKSLTDLRLRHHQHLGVSVYASYHPRDVINSAETKRKVWQDLLQIKNQLNKQTKL